MPDVVPNSLPTAPTSRDAGTVAAFLQGAAGTGHWTERAEYGILVALVFAPADSNLRSQQCAADNSHNWLVPWRRGH